jgi:hypothetical protein
MRGKKERERERDKKRYLSRRKRQDENTPQKVLTSSEAFQVLYIAE